MDEWLYSKNAKKKPDPLVEYLKSISDKPDRLQEFYSNTKAIRDLLDKPDPPSILAPHIQRLKEIGEEAARNQLLKPDSIPEVQFPNLITEKHGFFGRKGLLHDNGVIDLFPPKIIKDPFVRRVELRPRPYDGGFDVLDPIGHTFNLGIVRKFKR